MRTRMTAIGLGFVVLVVVAMGVGLNPRAEALIDVKCCDGTIVADGEEECEDHGGYQDCDAWERAVQACQQRCADGEKQCVA